MTIGPPCARTLAEAADADGSATSLRPSVSGQRLYRHQSPESAETTDPANVIATLTIDLPDELTEEAKSFGL